LKFSKQFDKDCKSIVLKLVEPDLSKRYGNLKNGINDIKTHQFFRDVNWTDMILQKFTMPFIPNIG
jgi:hypothetical protein